MIRFSIRPNRAHLIVWREWDDEAFRDARQQDKPVLLFIGAFWCGICQRMDETSFSREEVIALLNAYFVCIRVEESQRPDVDLRYNQGGWPTIVFLTPMGDLLFSVNYVEPEPFIDLLVRIVDSFQRDWAGNLSAVSGPGAAASSDTETEGPAPLEPAIAAEIAGMIEGLADPVYGGFGTEDKFLHTDANELLLHLFETTGEKWYLNHAVLTLDRMRQSRTFDAKDGGFFRYSSRRDWQEPHPEKLLDDEAALLGNYLHAYLITDAREFRQTAESLVDYLNATLLDEVQGVFFGCQDYVRTASGIAGAEPPAMESVIDACLYCDANARAAFAYLDAWWLLGSAECGERARSILEWLWINMRATDGGMLHYWDGAAHVRGLLMDTVMAGQALLHAYAVLGDPDYLERAQELAQYLLGRRGSPEGGFFDIEEAGPAALRVPMTVLTQNAALAAFFIQLTDLGGESQYRDAARWALRPFPNSHRRYGAFAAGFGLALSQLLAEPVPVTITGAPGDPGVRALLRAALTRLRPRRPIVRFRISAEGEKARVEIGGR